MNDDITIACIKNHVMKYQVAEKLGMNDSSFSRLLRKELPDEKKQKIFDIIEELSKKNI